MSNVTDVNYPRLKPGACKSECLARYGGRHVSILVRLCF